MFFNLVIVSSGRLDFRKSVAENIIAIIKERRGRGRAERHRAQEIFANCITADPPAELDE